MCTAVARVRVSVWPCGSVIADFGAISSSVAIQVSVCLRLPEGLVSVNNVRGITPWVKKADVTIGCAWKQRQ